MSQIIVFQAILFADSRTELTQFILDNKDAINSLFLDFGRDDSKVVYSMDELYHQIQRVADTVRRTQGGEEREEGGREGGEGNVDNFGVLL